MAGATSELERAEGEAAFSARIGEIWGVGTREGDESMMRKRGTIGLGTAVLC